ARCDGGDPDAETAEVAGHGQGHACDPGLGGGVGDLADLTLECRDRGGVHDDAAFAVIGLVATHVPGLQPVQIEGGDQIELDYRPEGVQGVGPALGERARRYAAAGRVDRDV